ncbi:SufD family Fe-S cluster assembly protein [Candidatus Vampirococcus lugosii]|uniref:Fe-S cluster assembly scaffold protein SufB n=1 Tax=Candidatus Vampirococcus lugosii TaxID=2789015 RepID=A0ABS5QKQ1_9BACT|nr:SufD family Fe-S cluster assembly protein [Candidatus Vampirococcus lugosii]MBS8121813.1 Fe-S cluster assembly scaffold protein SufB [Candidatus Vampirococcus lugosii]
MKIFEDGIYYINNSEQYIEVLDGKNILIIDFLVNNETKRYIKISCPANINYNLGIVGKNNFDIKIDILSGESCVNIKSLSFSKNKEEINGNLSINLLNKEIYSNTEIIGLCDDGGVINISGNVFIDFDSYKSEGYLNQKTVFLTDNGTSNITPTLNVSCNDVKASHGASISKLNEFDKFYICSKGIDLKSYYNLIISSYINNFNENLNNENISNKFFDYINN